MPYSHLHRMAKANCMDDLSSAGRHDSDFSELVWENGQIVLQGQSIKNRKSSNNGNTGTNDEKALIGFFFMNLGVDLIREIVNVNLYVSWKVLVWTAAFIVYTVVDANGGKCNNNISSVLYSC
ncbi:ATP-dependent DNA helicase pif3 [Ranunculus cassubicifolius]